MTKQGNGPAKGPKEKGPSETIPARRLGEWETFFYLVHEGLFGGPAVLCVSARIAGALDIQLVKHACRHLWERHPPLRARIMATDGGPSFVFDVPFRDIPIHSFFELGRTNLHTVVEREVDTLFDASKHLWRVLLITDKTDFERHYLLLSLHHSISDGKSAVRLAGELILCCTGILAGEILGADPLPLRPPLEDFIPSAGYTNPDTPPAAKGTHPGCEREGVMPFHEFQPTGRRHTRFRVHTLGPARSAALEERCGRSGVTVNAALAASTLAAMRKHFGEGALLSVDTPLSIRGYDRVQVGHDELWCMEIPVSTGYEGIAGRGVWQLARDYNDRLALVKSDGTNLFADVCRDPEKKIEELRTARHFPLSCLLIDAGRIGPVKGGPFVVESIGLTTGRQAADHIMVVSVATVGKALSLTFAYASPLIRESWADSFINDFLHFLEKAVK